MGTFQEITGKRFSHWTVLGPRTAVRTGSGQIKSYWRCRCDCGTEKQVHQGSLANGKSQSCGCIKEGNKYPLGVSVIRNIRASYRSSARRSNRTFLLSEAEFTALILSDCFYCGSGPKNTQIGYFGELVRYSGIDRVDNSRGYETENVVSCCSICNLGKRTLSQDDFLDMVRKIYERHFK